MNTIHWRVEGVWLILGAYIFVINEDIYENADGYDDDTDNDAAVTGDDKLSEGHADIRHHGERHPSARCKLDDDDNDDDDDDDDDGDDDDSFFTAAWTWHRLLIVKNLFK